MPPTSASAEPRLTGIAVCWGADRDLDELIAAWPADPRFELVVVDNGPGRGASQRLAAASVAPPAGLTLLEPGRNLGFAGGINAGVAAARAPAVLLLNPDAVPEPGALDALLAGLAAHPEAAGLAPRLIGPDGRSQHRWQLRPLPGVATLLAQTLFLPAGGGPREEPAASERVEQPAAAALLLRLSALEAAGGLDEGFHPAWFEDVDLARRLAAAGATLLYWPQAVFRHGLGAAVPRLGYGRFLWIYYRNLVRYLAKHHGALAAAAARAVLPGAALARLVALPLRRPRRAASRGEAARGLLALALGALTGWRRPRAWALELARPCRDGAR
jgi:GT2 family glycosyltransferase